jgi:protein-tyrosine-phosphatase
MIELIVAATAATGSAGAAYFSYRSAQASRAGAEAMDHIVALRKQAKAVLRDLSRTNATVIRITDKQYRQQQDVDDILYHAKIARERDQLNG